jgi:hypothetical protein
MQDYIYIHQEHEDWVSQVDWVPEIGLVSCSVDSTIKVSYQALAALGKVTNSGTGPQSLCQDWQHGVKKVWAGGLHPRAQRC